MPVLCLQSYCVIVVLLVVFVLVVPLVTLAVIRAEPVLCCACAMPALNVLCLHYACTMPAFVSRHCFSCSCSASITLVVLRADLVLCLRYACTQCVVPARCLY